MNADPISGCIIVKKTGIPIIIITNIMCLNLAKSNLSFSKVVAKKRITLIFANSDAWNPKVPIINQPLDPLVWSAKNIKPSRKTTTNAYKTSEALRQKLISKNWTIANISSPMNKKAICRANLASCGQVKLCIITSPNPFSPKTDPIIHQSMRSNLWAIVILIFYNLKSDLVFGSV